MLLLERNNISLEEVKTDFIAKIKVQISETTD
jgi:hypothetical protein